jgi:hypothetical protein
MRAPPANAVILTLAALALASVWHPAFAIVSGGVDPSTTLQSLYTYALPIGGSAICVTSIVKGVHAAMDGRSFKPHLAGLAGGAGLAYGGPYLMQHMGLT